MALVKNDLPILEYDTAPQSVLMPNRGEPYSFPPRAVFAFLGDVVDRYATEANCATIGEFFTITKLFPIYRAQYNGCDICLCQAPLGAPAAAQLLDFLIGYGVRQIIAVGSCGALRAIPENEWLVPTAALRDEGTSYHYLPPARTIDLNPRGVAAITRVLEGRGIAYERCLTWTTDGFFRETPDLVAYRRTEGCSVVEMECAALAAVAEFREALFAQLLFTADTLADAGAYDERDWGAASMPLALELALETASHVAD